MPLAERNGGSELMLERLLVASRDRADVEFSCVFFADGALARTARDAGVTCHVIAVGRLRQAARGLWGIVRIARVLRRTRPDVVLSWMSTAHLYAAPAAMLAGIPGRLVWWQHGRPGRDPLERLLHALPTRAVGCSSHDVAAQERRVYGAETFVVHPGLDLAELDAQLAGVDADVVRVGWSIPEGRRVVSVLGRLQAWKNQHLVIAAIGKLRDEGADVHLLIVGGDSYGRDPGYLPRLRADAERAGLADRVTFTGHLDAVAPALAVSDVLVSAAAAEPFGIVLLEAMAAGVPVVAVDAGGPREIVEDGLTGILVPHATANDLADGVRGVLAREHGARLGAAGRLRVQRCFSAEAMAAGVAAQLRRSVSLHPRRR